MFPARTLRGGDESLPRNLLKKVHIRRAFRVESLAPWLSRVDGVEAGAHPITLSLVHTRPLSGAAFLVLPVLLAVVTGVKRTEDEAAARGEGELVEALLCG